MIDVDLTTRGLQELQAENARRIAALQPSGAAGQAVKDATIETHRYLLSIVHVDTGSYRAANLMEINGLAGRVYIDESAVNPRSRQRVIDYAPIEEARGGSHAAYGRTVAEAGPRIRSRAEAYIRRSLNL